MSPTAPSPPVSASTPAAGDSVQDLSDAAEAIDDSITTMAPRVDAMALLEMARAERASPVAIPGSVEIRTVEDDELLDETEVRTRPGHTGLGVAAALLPDDAPLRGLSGQPSPPPRPAAGRPPSAAALGAAPFEGHAADDDGVTTQAVAPRTGSAPNLVAGLAPAIVADAAEEPRTRPGVEEADELATRPGLEGVAEPLTRPGVGEPETKPGLGDSPTASALHGVKPSTAGDDSYANEDDDEESVTARERAVEPYDGDSVTTQAPNVPLALIDSVLNASTPDSFDDTTGGTTQRVKARSLAASSPADGEVESITTQAPGPLTNILRVIASESSPDAGGAANALLDEDEEPENHTEVMANAPLQHIVAETAAPAGLPPIRPTGGPLQFGPQGSRAPNAASGSLNGMLVARSGSGTDERGSLGMPAAGGDPRTSGVLRAEGSPRSDAPINGGMDQLGHAATEMAFPHAQGAAQPDLADGHPGVAPRYGLLVGIVAAISVLVPITLFFVLRHNAEPVARALPAEAVSDVQTRDGPRGRAVRGRNGVMRPPATASAAPTGQPVPSGATGGSPFRR